MAGTSPAMTTGQARLASLPRVREKPRSGKILRGTMKKIADHEPFNMPTTIDDPVILDEIGGALKGKGVGA